MRTDPSTDPIGYAAEIVERDARRGGLFTVSKNDIYERVSRRLNLTAEEEEHLAEDVDALTDEVIERLVEHYWFETVCEVCEQTLVDDGMRIYGEEE